MIIEIKCAHPPGKRVFYGSGWQCAQEKGGCGSTGSGHEDLNPTSVYFAEISREEIGKFIGLLKWGNEQ